MKNLGKIVALLFLIPHAIYASVEASLDSRFVELGEMVTYSLSISGEDIERPNIHTLCDTDVISTSSQRSIVMVNGDVEKKYILSYKFIPQKSCEIEPIEIEVDGKIERSNAVSLKIKDGVAAQDAEFVLTLSSSKKEVFIGEPFEVTLLFKQREGAEAVDSKFVPPELKGFWIKEESKPVRYKEGEFTITKLTYTMSAQRVGNLHISKAQMKIASRSNKRDSWGAWIPNIKWRTYFSNELSIDVKALPVGVDLIGDFSIGATVDKNEINANEALNVRVQVSGVGNLEDIKSFKPYIEGVSVFDEKIAVAGSKLTQKMAFVADEDFTVPPFSLKYYDLKTKEVKTISTKEIKVLVKGAKVKPELTIKRPQDSEVKSVTEASSGEFSILLVIVTFIIGLACGIVLILFKPWKILFKEKELNIKDPKVLLMKLLPFKSDEEVQKIIDILENNLYSDIEQEVDKKVLKEIVKKYEI
ncbi:MAG: BatD family protein [Campylobacterota bacterium]|nr:BatD family protein [Campylobacterota bacterium]